MPPKNTRDGNTVSNYLNHWRLKMIRITAEGNNAEGKTMVLVAIAEALKAKGFTDVQFINPEQSEHTRQDILNALGDNQRVLNTKIELHEKFGTIE